MSRETVIADLRSMSPGDFVAHHIFDKCPHVFSERNDFIRWKKDLSRDLQVDAAAITIVGSAATGVSLSPYKSLKSFDDKSDIDVAIISSHHFMTAWRFLRMNGRRRHSITPAQRASWDRHQSGLVYYGTIATDKLLSLMPFGADWMKAAASASNNKSIRDREVLFRIYHDYDALRSYQIRSVKEAAELALSQ